MTLSEIIEVLLFLLLCVWFVLERCNIYFRDYDNADK